MYIENINEFIESWTVQKIGVIGPGIVGMPMAAMLANAEIKIGTNHPAEVVVVQRNSKNSGWKVPAINSGKAVIGGIEPTLNRIVSESVKRGYLSATHDPNELRDADVILVCVQTDKKGFGPDYEPLFGALENLAEALRHKPKNNIPLVIFESTLAPSSMMTLIKDHFAKYDLIESENILLGNSPNRVMPGRLVERVTNSDKLVAGLHPVTPKLIQMLYSRVVTKGTLYPTNSLTAEMVKTLENAYRDVRIAFSTEVVRYCDKHNIDYYALRDAVNRKSLQEDSASDDPNAVPSGGLLIPTLGVGGHCLPKDGILLWWRKNEKGDDTKYSLILKSREINNASPAETLNMAEESFGSLRGKNVVLLGAAYRFNSEDTRNSPTLVLANLLLEKDCQISIHDPHVKSTDQNLQKENLVEYFTNDLSGCLEHADYAFVCVAHKEYMNRFQEIVDNSGKLNAIIDACNIYSKDQFKLKSVQYIGIGRGERPPDKSLINDVYQAFKSVETGVANEVYSLILFLNKVYANSEFNKIHFQTVQKLAASCSTGCIITEPGRIKTWNHKRHFSSELVECAQNAQQYSVQEFTHK